MSNLAPGTRREETALDDEIEELLQVLPSDLYAFTHQQPRHNLIEVVLDLGRPVLFRFTDRQILMDQRKVNASDIEEVAKQVGSFTADNRAGIERTLHRISAIRNRKGKVVGLTLRVGRAIYGTIDLMRDLIETGLNLLVLGPPGVGKTTKLREIARVLSTDYQKRVIVVDTSNEIGGDGDIPHPGIGDARRMQVSHPDQQHSVMIEAVENHMPEVVVVDEIGTQAEALAARTIAERGVQLIATAHGTTLENLVLNPTLSDLIGGVHTVTLSDEEARRRHSPKTINERRAPPTFDILIEMVSHDEIIVHKNVADAVDILLTDRPPQGERRNQKEGITTEMREPEITHEPISLVDRIAEARKDHPVKVYPYAINPELLERVIRNQDVQAAVVDDVHEAELVVALRARENDIRLKKLSKLKSVPVYYIKKNSATQMRKILDDIFSAADGSETEDVRDAIRETEYAIQRVINEGVEVPLAPRTARLRRFQHRIVSRYHLEAKSEGKDPIRHLVIFPAV